MTDSKRVVIAGGSGSVGRALARHLGEQGFEVTILTRTPNPTLFPDETGIRQLQWDGRTTDPSWGREVVGSVLINLAGELVDRVPTEANIDLLEQSRVVPTETLVRAAREFGRPRLWLQMSTLAIYGDAGDQLLDEHSQPADGPRQMAGVAKAWEAAVSHAHAERVVWLRTAVVLQRNTPALNRLVTITRLFLGGRIGSGRQWVSWIHERDFLRAIDFIIANEVQAGANSDRPIHGPIHITSPNPVQNRELMSTLRHTIGRPWSPPLPAFATRLGAKLLFRTDPQLALTGRRAVPSKLLATGFEFEFPELGPALADLLKKTT